MKKRRQIWETPGAKGRGTVQQADSMLKWWRFHCKEVPRSNRLLISDIRELLRLVRRVRSLKAKKSQKATEKEYLANTERMLKAVVMDVAAEMHRLEERE